MLRKLLPIGVVLALASQGWSQCTPDQQYANEEFGVWPDTVNNFPTANLGEFYSTVIDFKFPTDGGAVDQQYEGMPVDSGVVTDVEGLPPGMTYACNDPGCSYLGGTQGCALISGTCNQFGTYEITIKIDGWTHIFNQPVLIPLEFPGYQIHVWPVSVNENQDCPFEVMQNNPNPFTNSTQITYYSPGNGKVEFEVYNLLGERVRKQDLLSKPGKNIITFHAGTLPHGIYMYSLSNGEQPVTKRMIIGER